MVRYVFVGFCVCLGVWGVSGWWWGDAPSRSGIELDAGSVQLGSSGAHDFRIGWLVAAVNCGQEAQLTLGKPIEA